MEGEPNLEILDNSELQEMFDGDQEDRKNFDWEKNSHEDFEEIRKKDRKRIAFVREMINEGKLQTGADYYHAAIILQHGEELNDYLKANELAKKAMELGDDRSPLLVASSWDRYLMKNNQPFQKYGTQYIKVDGREELYPVDPDTTDEERAKFNVPPLEKLKEGES